LWTRQLKIKKRNALNVHVQGPLTTLLFSRLKTLPTAQEYHNPA